MGNYQFFKRNAFSYIFKFFIVTLLSLSLVIDIDYDYSVLFSEANVVILGFIVLVFVTAVWEAVTPLVAIEGEVLRLQLTMLEPSKTINLGQVIDIDINTRYTLMTLVDNEDTTMRIPLNLIKGDSNRDALVDMIEENIEKLQQGNYATTSMFQELENYTTQYAK